MNRSKSTRKGEKDGEKGKSSKWTFAGIFGSKKDKKDEKASGKPKDSIKPSKKLPDNFADLVMENEMKIDSG